VSTEPPVVLYAENNYLLAQTVKDVLELVGCRVEHCKDGVMALALLRSAEDRAQHYDLLLLDNDLTSISGLELTRHARRMRQWQHTPIILLALEDCTAAALEAGADELLRKPNNLLTLADAVRRLLSEGKRRVEKAKGKRQEAKGKS
jgi:CheY-like chemotaxis protein